MTISKNLIYSSFIITLVILILPFIQGLSYDLYFEIRLPTYISAFSVGALLSLVGLSFQRIFRNDLAGPYTIGISSSASLGILILSALGINSWFLSSFVGIILGLLVLIPLWSLMNGRDKANAHNLILAGVALNILFSGLIILILFFSMDLDFIKLVHWTMGNIQSIGWLIPSVCFFSLLLLLLNLMSQHRNYDSLLLGDELLIVEKFPLKKFKINQLIILTILLGVCVSLHGPVSFIGFVVPHLIKNTIGAGRNYKELVTLSAIWGGTLLTLFEGLTYMSIFRNKIPVGVVTTILGSLCFLYILLKNRGNN